MDFMLDTSKYDSRRWDWRKGWVCDLPMDWRAGEAIGLTCASMKAGEGISEDPAFRMNWTGAQGRPREAWWFFRQNVNAIAQAQKFLSVILDDWTENDQATIDWETTDGVDRLGCLRNGGSFLYETEKELGKPSAIYTYPAYWIDIGGAGATGFKRYPLHLAQWPLDNWIANLKTPPYSFNKQKLADLKARIEAGNLKPMHLVPWGNDIMAWQFTARAWTKDIPGHPAVKLVADVNVIYKPWWTGGSPVQPPPVVVPVPVPEGSFFKVSAWIAYIYPQANDRPGKAFASLMKGMIVTVSETANSYSHITNPVDGWTATKNLIEA